MKSLAFLKKEFNKRKKRNASYSLRSFARDLEISPGHLSLLFNGKRELKSRQALKIAKTLGLSKSGVKALLFDVASEATVVNGARQDEERVLRDDELALISSWHYYALLSLAKLKDSQYSAAWISQRLGISGHDAEIALNRLSRMGLIAKKGSELIRLEKPLRTSKDIPSKVRRDFHRQWMALADKKLELVPMTLREMCSVTMVADPENLTKVKDLIAEFKDQVCYEMEQGNPSEVFTLSLQLFPVTQFLEEN